MVLLFIHTEAHSSAHILLQCHTPYKPNGILVYNLDGMATYFKNQPINSRTEGGEQYQENC